jgi:hypothetical protein
LVYSIIMRIFVKEMKWETINITDKIEYLKKLMVNTIDGHLDTGDVQIVNALITGSLNNLNDDDDYGFDIKPHHINFMRKLWNTAIQHQINDSVIVEILRGKS